MPNSVYLFSLPNGAVIQEGTGTATAVVGGVLTVNTTQTGTGNDTTEDTLWSYTLPANTLSADGKGVRTTVSGKFAANADAKTVRVYFGTASQTLVSSVPFNGVNFSIMFTVLRSGSSAQVVSGVLVVGGGSTQVLVTTASQTDTANIVIKCTGQNGAANANDIVFTSAIVEALD